MHTIVRRKRSKGNTRHSVPFGIKKLSTGQIRFGSLPQKGHLPPGGYHQVQFDLLETAPSLGLG